MKYVRVRVLEGSSMYIVVCSAVILICCEVLVKCDLISDLSLPRSHLPLLFHSSRYYNENCVKDRKCKSHYLKEDNMCWGYEPGCEFSGSYSKGLLKCPKPSTWGPQEPQKQMESFWREGDFRKLSAVVSSIKPICTSRLKGGSFLECSDHLRFCRGSNIFFDFKSLNAKSSQRYRDDVIHKGEVGGRCDSLNLELLAKRSDEKSYLQSWGHELQHFQSYQNFKVDSSHCDIIFDRPTFVMKLDASVNMYHHFCDFVNLYASQHVNGSFDMDVDIVWWDTFSGGFVDALFGVTWKAFSRRKPFELISFDKKKVCFRSVVLPLLARQRLGLYYNMPLIDGCEGSGLFKAFSEHLTHRLDIKQNGPLLGKVRVTLLSRSTRYRRIVNENELFEALEAIPTVVAKRVDYNRNVPFINQLESTYNTDVFIGMHGSGLTHLLFLPEWATVFEIYNCGDVTCYLDLARLRGVKYFTWRREDKVEQVGDGTHPQSGTPHKKFADYRFDVDEFKNLVTQQIQYVRSHPAFVKEQRRLRRNQAQQEL